jgi:hypothetical protein
MQIPPTLATVWEPVSASMEAVLAEMVEVQPLLVEPVSAPVVAAAGPLLAEPSQVAVEPVAETRSMPEPLAEARSVPEALAAKMERAEMAEETAKPVAVEPVVVSVTEPVAAMEPPATEPVAIATEPVVVATEPVMASTEPEPVVTSPKISAPPQVSPMSSETRSATPTSAFSDASKPRIGTPSPESTIPSGTPIPKPPTRTTPHASSDTPEEEDPAAKPKKKKQAKPGLDEYLCGTFSGFPFGEVPSQPSVVFGDSAKQQRGLLGRYAEREELVYLNTHDPFFLVSLGASGSGKTHTLGVVLENLLVPAPPHIRLAKSIPTLVHSYYHSTILSISFKLI